MAGNKYECIDLKNNELITEVSNTCVKTNHSSLMFLFWTNLKTRTSNKEKKTQTPERQLAVFLSPGTPGASAFTCYSPAFPGGTACVWQRGRRAPFHTAFCPAPGGTSASGTSTLGSAGSRRTQPRSRSSRGSCSSAGHLRQRHPTRPEPCVPLSPPPCPASSRKGMPGSGKLGTTPLWAHAAWPQGFSLWDHTMETDLKLLSLGTARKTAGCSAAGRQPPKWPSSFPQPTAAGSQGNSGWEAAYRGIESNLLLRTGSGKILLVPYVSSLFC